VRGVRFRRGSPDRALQVDYDDASDCHVYMAITLI